ncbi:putative late blight resistance protein homolog r1a-6 [Phtheirospermum japonicum]|uniref:Putative late blight resistance protein homolog r1a-6 n=1 Tax=Phtheirospermum japonicum TaxID=374723 RepID=A0A830B301_9LAMI|nr:putative late blight resistance protein homolog r1a-6 [Phtheirospermum japonicum]
MAYAALISLKQTIQRFVNSHILIVPSVFVSLQELQSRSFLTRRSGKELLSEITDFAFFEVESLQQILKDINSSEKLNALDGQIREAAYVFEDILESHLSAQFILQSDQRLGDFDSSLDLQKLKQDIDSFTETAKMMKKELIYELDNPLPQNYDHICDFIDVSSIIDFSKKETKMVGVSDHLRDIESLVSNWWSSKVQTISLVGMAGIGKTTLAKEVFEDPSILRLLMYRGFQCRAFVTIGPNYRLREVMLSILSQVDRDSSIMQAQVYIYDDELAEHLKESLLHRRYFIVLDDVWSEQVWDDLKGLFPEINNGSRILLTTRLEEVARASSNEEFAILKMCLLNKEESWKLLREKVFDDKSACPSQLEKAGRKIAENCDGLPILIVTVAKILQKAEKTLEYWNKVAEKENLVFDDAYDQISDVLYPSYMYLPQRLKACFLYMGAFPQKYEIPRSKLLSLWVAEGFLEPDRCETVECFAEKCLEGLVSRNLVIAHKTNFSGRIKTCSLHSVFWRLCNVEASKNKFSHVAKSCADGLVGAIKSQRRLCIHNNILFGIKDVHKSMASIVNARTLICSGPHHQYPVPICFGLRLLRVLDALTICFYEFPMDVSKLVQLRYLALTYNGIIHSSISKLRKLQFLIVRRHMGTRSSSTTLSYLPIEIWNMEELKHIQITGSDLLDPRGALLPNLLTLLDVSARSCTEDVLLRIPNLLKLGVRIELSPSHHDDEPLWWFDRLSHLRKVKSLKCVVVNPTLRSNVAPRFSHSLKLPSSLVKLTLSGFGFAWKCMEVIANLRMLQVLKLQFYAFSGPKWESYDYGFYSLDVLVIEDADLVHWRVEHEGCIPRLKLLIIRHCYRLEEIPMEIGRSLEKIEIVDSNSLAVTCAKDIEKDQRRKGAHFLEVIVQSSKD